MKVSEYHKQGLKRFVDSEPQFVKKGEAKEGVHRISLYILPDGKCVFNASRRCKKLLAITDFACDYYSQSGRFPSEDEILKFFGEEKDRAKMKARIEILRKAIESIA